MQSRSRLVHVFPFRKLIPREMRRSLRSPSFETGLLVVLLMLIATVSIVLLSSWFETLTLFGK
jgi:hypothetical protein